MMWLFTEVGFFSVTRVPRSSDLQVRARVREDLDVLRDRYIPSLSDTHVTPQRDYPYRAFCTHLAMAKAVARVVQDIDYVNFKNRVTEVQGLPRHNLYAKVWEVMHRAEEKIRKARMWVQDKISLDEEIAEILKLPR